MDLLIWGGGFRRRYHRLSPERERDAAPAKLFLPESFAFAWSSSTTGDRCGQESAIPEGDLGVETDGRTGSMLPLSTHQVLEQHTGARPPIRKRRVRASQGFREFDSAWRTLQGIEAMNMIRKGQIRWIPKADIASQVMFLDHILRADESVERRPTRRSLRVAFRRCNTTSGHEPGIFAR